jgi:hypothetical protein
VGDHCPSGVHHVDRPALESRVALIPRSVPIEVVIDVPADGDELEVAEVQVLVEPTARTL